jgi:hypothetical protein
LATDIVIEFETLLRESHRFDLLGQWGVHPPRLTKVRAVVEALKNQGEITIPLALRCPIPNNYGSLRVHAKALDLLRIDVCGAFSRKNSFLHERSADFHRSISTRLASIAAHSDSLVTLLHREDLAGFLNLFEQFSLIQDTSRSDELIASLLTLSERATSNIRYHRGHINRILGLEDEEEEEEEEEEKEEN